MEHKWNGGYGQTDFGREEWRKEEVREKMNRTGGKYDFIFREL